MTAFVSEATIMLFEVTQRPTTWSSPVGGLMSARLFVASTDSLHEHVSLQIQRQVDLDLELYYDFTGTAVSG